MSTVKTTNLQHPSSGSANITLAADGSVVLPAGFTGGIGSNVVSTTLTTPFSTTTVAGDDVTGLTATITPTSATAKILLIASVDVGVSADAFVVLNLRRDGSDIAIGTSVGSRKAATVGRYLGTATTGAGKHTSMPILFLDSPTTTSAVTYGLRIAANAAATLTVNRDSTDNNASGTFRPVSTITAIEVAA